MIRVCFHVPNVPTSVLQGTMVLYIIQHKVYEHEQLFFFQANMNYKYKMFP